MGERLWRPEITGCGRRRMQQSQKIGQKLTSSRMRRRVLEIMDENCWLAGVVHEIAQVSNDAGFFAVRTTAGRGAEIHR